MYLFYGDLKLMATLSGEVTLSFYFCLPSQWVSTLKERICTSWCTYFLLQIDPFLTGFSGSKQKVTIIWLFPRQKSGGKSCRCMNLPQLKLLYFFGYKREFFPSKTIQKI